MKHLRRLFDQTMLVSFATLVSCQGLTIGPTIQREFILVKPGQPIVVLSNVFVRGQRLDDQGVVDSQSIGGWVAMPREHWDVLKSLLEGSESGGNR